MDRASFSLSAQQRVGGGEGMNTSISGDEEEGVDASIFGDDTGAEGSKAFI